MRLFSFNKHGGKNRVPWGKVASTGEKIVYHGVRWCALLPYPRPSRTISLYLFYKSNVCLFIVFFTLQNSLLGLREILPPACRRHPADALSTPADSTCELTNLLQRAVRLEGHALTLALPVAVDADIPKLRLLLNVPNQPFGIGDILHVRDEEPNTINTITGTDREIVRVLLLETFVAARHGVAGGCASTG